MLSIFRKCLLYLPFFITRHNNLFAKLLLSNKPGSMETCLVWCVSQTFWMRSRISWLLSRMQDWKMCRSMSCRTWLSHNAQLWNNTNQISVMTTKSCIHTLAFQKLAQPQNGWLDRVLACAIACMLILSTHTRLDTDKQVDISKLTLNQL
jgi:hypothetical protein